MAKNGLRKPRHGSFIQAWKGTYRVKIIAGTQHLSRDDATLIGQTQFTKALGTANLSEAERRAPTVLDELVAEIKMRIEAVKPLTSIVPAEKVARYLIPKLQRHADILGCLKGAYPAVAREFAAQANPLLPPPVTTFDEIIVKWVAERKIGRKGETDMRRVIRDLCACIKRKEPGFKDDPARVTEQHMRDFKDWMVGQEYSSTSIKNYKSQLRTIFQYAVDEYPDIIPVMPIAGFKYLVKKIGQDNSDEKRGFTESEARLILERARLETDPVRRWLPFLLCWTGARISEIVGSKASAIRRSEGSTAKSNASKNGIWCIELRWWSRNPKERLKNESSLRSVPLALALLREGFLDYFATLDPDGPLFPQIKPAEFDGRRGSNASKRMSRLVRHDLKLADPLIEPDHSWRHRFSTVCGLNIPDHRRKAIMGHSEPGAAGKYGETPLLMAQQIIDGLPNPLAELAKAA
jgi:integrase